MSGSIKHIDAQALKAALHDDLEIALLDAREELTFGERHILVAACMPLGRIEVLADDMDEAFEKGDALYKKDIGSKSHIKEGWSSEGDGEDK